MTTAKHSTRRNGRLAVLALTAVVALPLSLEAQALNACDLNSDGAVNNTDVQLAVNMSLGTVTCTANIIGAGVCNVVVVQRVINALGGTCVTGTARAVDLTWTASTSTGVTGYRVYRSTTAGGPYTEVTTAPVTGTSFTDQIVQGGLTYYYVVRAVDSGGNQSGNSNQATAAIPVG